MRANRSVIDESASELEALGEAQAAFAERYPGEPRRRQPVHTFYQAAQFFSARAIPQIGEIALRSLARYGRDADEFARGLGAGHLSVELSSAVYSRVHIKLRREPVEDLRIDFEDGFGVRPDAEEDRFAVETARELARAIEAGHAPPFTGIRIKSLGPEGVHRAARTLQLFIERLLDERQGDLPEGFVVTLPKVNVPEQPRTLARWLDRLERRHALKSGSLRFEMMVETPQALMGPDGRSPLPSFLDASEGRCTGVHLGVYDFTASCGISATHQSMAHPMCELARGWMRLACGGRGVFLSDGSTHVLPVGPHAGDDLTEGQDAENLAAVHRSWSLSYAHIRHSLEGGFYQGWDLHPAQLPVRFAACFAFFREGFTGAAERLRAFVDRATHSTQIADEPATAQALLTQVRRALASGAVDDADGSATGLTREELAMPSIADIVTARSKRC